MHALCIYLAGRCLHRCLRSESTGACIKFPTTRPLDDFPSRRIGEDGCLLAINAKFIRLRRFEYLPNSPLLFSFCRYFYGLAELYRSAPCRSHVRRSYDSGNPRLVCVARINGNIACVRARRDASTTVSVCTYVETRAYNPHTDILESSRGDSATTEFLRTEIRSDATAGLSSSDPDRLRTRRVAAGESGIGRGKFCLEG